MELLVVLVILGLIGALVAPRVISYLGGAKADAAALQVDRLDELLDLYSFEVGSYPTHAEGLKALVEKPLGADAWNGPYVKKP